MNIKTRGLLFLSISIIVSCSNNMIKEYYATGKLYREYEVVDGKKNGVYKEFYKDGNIKLKHIFESGNMKDSSVYYYKAPKNKIKFIRYWQPDNNIKEVNFNIGGQIESEGYLVQDSLRIGKWVFYDENNMKRIREYKMINGESYTNQEWFVDNSGDTLNYGNFFSIIYNKDTVLVGEPVKAIAYLDVPLFKDKKSEIVVAVSAKGSADFKEDFSNMGTVDAKIFDNLKKDSKNQRFFHGYKDNFEHTVAFGKTFPTAGKKVLRGYILEYYRHFSENDSIKREERKMFFEKEIYVKDSSGSKTR